MTMTHAEASARLVAVAMTRNWLWTVSSWNKRAMRCEADERLVYRGPSRAEAARIFEGLAKWKRRGIVEMVSPWGTVSQVCKTDDPATSWRTEYAHDCPIDTQGEPK